MMYSGLSPNGLVANRQVICRSLKLSALIWSSGA